jgi:hypothetical protein
MLAFVQSWCFPRRAIRSTRKRPTGVPQEMLCIIRTTALMRNFAPAISRVSGSQNPALAQAERLLLKAGTVA